MRFRRSKYGNVKTASKGVLLDSKLEADRYDELFLLQLAGEITDLRRQVWVSLPVNGMLICRWRVDFQYLDNRDGKLVWEDPKGKQTEPSRIKIRLARALFPNVRIEIWKGGRMN
jgi:hypothetical protein